MITDTAPIILVRHTRVTGTEGLCYGRHDVALASTFDEEASAVAAQLPWTPQAILSSPATRCRRLAGVLAAAAGIEVQVEPRLAEMDMGEWEGRRWDALSGPAFEAWKADPWHTAPPGGESPDAFVARVAGLRSELLAARPDRLLLVTHAGVIRAWRCAAEHRTLEDIFGETVGFGSLWPDD